VLLLFADYIGFDRRATAVVALSANKEVIGTWIVCGGQQDICSPATLNQPPDKLPIMANNAPYEPTL
jgi:hypothetical protein